MLVALSAARYEVTLGANPFNAVGFYHQAITLDPSIGEQLRQSGRFLDCIRIASR